MKIMSYATARALKDRLSPPKTSHESVICAEAKRVGVTIRQRGKALWFLGHGVDFLAADFRAVHVKDLQAPFFTAAERAST